ncbi:MAG: SUMF1/EgtB/PvdO family nonheme iron enzyme [Tannerellaceae bacterium]|nr:SUMF1/EgtB/PvdO family nonheme iron enzyme [Tannerellaceae bacterium]
MKKNLITLLPALLLSVCSVAQEKNSLGMDMVPIPSGTFYMGGHGLGANRDEAPIHQVTIARAFYMSATEVTNAQYEQFDPDHKSLRGKFGLSQADDEAVIFVNYYQAKAFCDWLSKKEGKPYRLPTEAEWEYACKAGTYLTYSMDDGLPALYHKNQSHTWGVNNSVNLQVGTTPANPFGLYDMHGNVEEWCEDWYGPYADAAQTDPVGPADGLFKVTRGGSHSTPVNYLRSTNRMAMMPEDSHWLTGFRVVQGEMPATPYLAPVQYKDPNPVLQQVYQWKQPRKEAFFEEPLMYVKRPECTSDVPFYHHNHCPAITWCRNGDLLAIWFSTDDESGREMTILASRLPAGTANWTEPYEFFKVPDRNMTGSSLYHDGNGTLIHVNGVEAAGTWQTLAMVLRTSTDNGVTWSKPSLISADHSMRNQVIAGMFSTKEGWLVQLADATPWGDGGTALHLSKDNGQTWEDPGKGKMNAFSEGGTGGTIAGIHAGAVQLSNGDFLAFGRGNSIVDKQGLDRMPVSISSDQGKTWHYTASEFPPIDGGQRLVLMRLKEGPILLVSFTNHPYRLKNDQKGMEFIDKEGKSYTGYGMFAALSFDEGKSWPVKKLLTDGQYRFMDGGAWTGWFEMDETHAEPRGYLAATQTPDQTIHLVSSKNHYRFNLQWLLSGTLFDSNCCLK